MLGGIEGRRRRGWQRMRCLDGTTDSMDMSLSEFWNWWWIGRPGMLRFMGSQRVRHDWATELTDWLKGWQGGASFHRLLGHLHIFLREAPMCNRCFACFSWLHLLLSLSCRRLYIFWRLNLYWMQSVLISHRFYNCKFTYLLTCICICKSSCVVIHRHARGGRKQLCCLMHVFPAEVK